jgi:hypothetical protein
LLILNTKYQVTGWEITPFRDYENDTSSNKFLLLAKNQLHKEDAWYAPRTNGGKK